jgi:hypothetical protein
MARGGRSCPAASRSGSARASKPSRLRSTRRPGSSITAGAGGRQLPPAVVETVRQVKRSATLQAPFPTWHCVTPRCLPRKRPPRLPVKRRRPGMSGPSRRADGSRLLALVGITHRGSCRCSPPVVEDGDRFSRSPGCRAGENGRSCTGLRPGWRRNQDLRPFWAYPRSASAGRSDSARPGGG